MRSFLAAFGISALALAGCSSDDSNGAGEPGTTDPVESVEVVRSEQTRDMNPVLTAAEQETFAKGEAAFAIDVFHAAVKESEGKNVFLSPHSISTALGMTYAGARGATAAEMKSALHFGLPDDRIHAAFNYLDLELSRRGQGASGKDGKPFRLNVSNSIWSQKGFSFEQPFLDTMAINYGAGINVVDFRADTENSRQTINGWVEKKTEERIKDLLPPGAVTTDTIAVLVNAVYFNAGWRLKFQPDATKSSSFKKVDGSLMPSEMMHITTGSFRYANGEAYEAIELPYDGDELSMLVIAPKEATGYGSFEDALTGDSVLDILSGLEPRTVDLGFPKLKLDASFKLKSALKGLGMVHAFDNSADFSGLSTSVSLKIDEVLHKTFLALDENGTEAAAATAVIAVPTSLPQDVVTFNVDRPFITAIVDKKTSTLVFVGRILEPKN